MRTARCKQAAATARRPWRDARHFCAILLFACHSTPSWWPSASQLRRPTRARMRCKSACHVRVLGGGTCVHLGDFSPGSSQSTLYISCNETWLILLQRLHTVPAHSSSNLLQPPPQQLSSSLACYAAEQHPLITAPAAPAADGTANNHCNSNGRRRQRGDQAAGPAAVPGRSRRRAPRRRLYTHRAQGAVSEGYMARRRQRAGCCSATLTMPPPCAPSARRSARTGMTS